MADKSINSLLGMLSTKELPASGILKNTNNSIKGNHEKNSFLEKLVNSMKNTHASEEPTATAIPSELNNITGTDDINHIKKLLLMGLQTNLTAETNNNQIQLNQETNHNILGEAFTNAIINNSSNYKTSTARIGSNTLLENALLNNQELKLPGGPNANIAQKQTGDLIPEPTASFSGKLNTTQVTTNIAQQIPGEIEQEQLHTALSDKLNTTQVTTKIAQNNTKIGEQRILDIINSPGLSEAATESRSEESMLQLSKLAARQSTAPSESNLNKNQNKSNIKDNRDPVSTIEKAGSNPISDAQKISNNKIINLNTSPPADESANNKTNEMLKGQHQDKALSPNADKNPQTQQGLALAQSESDETPHIFEVSTNTTEAKAAKLFDNTALTSNNGVNIAEAATSSNTSSDNSTFNNQGTDTDYDFNLNTVNNSQKTKPETNFNNTLSQIKNSGKPLGALGNDVADNIIQNAKSYTLGGKSEVKIQLNPPELGTLKLEFTLEDDILETKITVEKSSVKDVIEKDIPRLRELISNSDIDAGKLEVSLQEKENGKQDFMNKDFHSNSKSKSTHDFQNQENEYYEDNLDEETMANNPESTQINYLV